MGFLSSGAWYGVEYAISMGVCVVPQYLLGLNCHRLLCFLGARGWCLVRKWKCPPLTHFGFPVGTPAV